MKKYKVSIITLGCKVNQYESNAIAKELEDNGFEVYHELTIAQAYVLNTCAVTNEAEKKSRGVIAKIRKLSSDALIYVCGCSSQNNPDKFKEYSNIKSIYGTSNKQDLAAHIIADFKGKDKSNNLRINTEIDKSYKDSYLTAKGNRTRLVMKIQEGCNNFCSYCLIPYLRGRERSRIIESVKQEIDLHSSDCKEIIFTGINLSNYGKDLNLGYGLKDIAILMRNYPNIRFRFSSLEQDIITKEFLEELAKTPNFAPHFHLSLQSGCDRTLKLMNRKYLSEDYYSKVKLIREFFDNPAITTDVIVGFPTELEEDFEQCYNFAKKCKFAKMHIFPYSKRSGTLAANMKNQATNVKERVQKLSELDKQMFYNYINSCVGKDYNVIIEQIHEGMYVGHTENYIKCYINTSEILMQNQLVKVKIANLYKDGATAELLSY